MALTLETLPDDIESLKALILAERAEAEAARAALSGAVLERNRLEHEHIVLTAEVDRLTARNERLDHFIGGGSATAANRLVPDGDPTPVDETGPSEVRALSAAFNDMQKRVKHLVDDRTQTLAAISHDLKTPLTRMRLRTEDIVDPELARAVTTDLAEMEAMLDSTIAFLRGDQLGEEKKPIDLGSLLETIGSDLTDLGHDVTLTRTAPTVVVRGRHLALKRALENLVENAVKYGVRARVTLEGSADGAAIVIDDDGPGIPEIEKEAVFRPFYRIDDSRNRETGGVGLGLTVARSIIQSHAGELALSNRAEGGLHAIVTLPR